MVTCPRGQKRSAGVALMMLPCIGCSATPGDSYSLDIDPAFTSDEQAAIVAAVEDWQGQVPVHFKVDVRSCSGSRAHYVCMHQGIPDQHGSPKNASGWCSLNEGTDGGEIWLLSSAPTQQSATHELGHAMGLRHQGPTTDEPCDSPIVMAPDPDVAAKTVQFGDVAQWYTVRHMVVP
jgi:hypothetical protein